LRGPGKTMKAPEEFAGAVPKVAKSGGAEFNWHARWHPGPKTRAI
jgi:hypothetical protein